MVMLVNIVFLVLILRFSFENKVMNFLLDRRLPGLIMLQHLIFSIGFIIANMYVYFQLFGFPQGIYRLIFVLIINIPMYYLCYGKLVPEYYQTKKYPEFFRYTAGIFVISCLIRILIEPEISIFSSKNVPQDLFLLLVYLTQTTVIVTSCLLGISKYKLIVEKELASLEIQKKQSDLDLIKSKINPHFLLNTLNNIYSRSYNHAADSADLIMQLSLLLQYTTYEIGKKRIAINKEIQMIKALTSLYQLKYSKKLNITFEYASDELLYNIEIPPTIYFTLFENALKYSCIGMDDQAYIYAKFELKESEISFFISNHKSAMQCPVSNNYFKGIGTEVLKKMMDMEYSDNYQYEVTESPVNYVSRLTIKI